MKRLVLTSFVSLLFLTLVGCGFHLRSAANLSDEIQPLRIEGISHQRGIGLKLKRALLGNGVIVADTLESEAATLKIVSHTFDRRVLSVGTNAKVSEYELYAQMTFIVLGKAGQVLAEQQTVQAQRDYQFNEDEVLGRESEEQYLREQLDQQLIQSVVRRLSAIK